MRKNLKSKGTSKGSWTGERIATVHGAVLGLTAFVESSPYTIPPELPDILVTLVNYMNLPHPISVSIQTVRNWSELVISAIVMYQYQYFLPMLILYYSLFPIPILEIVGIPILIIDLRLLCCYATNIMQL